jgi:hypothetical protein
MARMMGQRFKSDTIICFFGPEERAFKVVCRYDRKTSRCFQIVYTFEATDLKGEHYNGHHEVTVSMDKMWGSKLFSPPTINWPGCGDRSIETTRVYEDLLHYAILIGEDMWASIAELPDNDVEES